MEFGMGQGDSSSTDKNKSTSNSKVLWEKISGAGVYSHLRAASSPWPLVSKSKDETKSDEKEKEKLKLDNWVELEKQQLPGIYIKNITMSPSPVNASGGLGITDSLECAVRDGNQHLKGTGELELVQYRDAVGLDEKKWFVGNLDAVLVGASTSTRKRSPSEMVNIKVNQIDIEKDDGKQKLISFQTSWPTVTVVEHKKTTSWIPLQIPVAAPKPKARPVSAKNDAMKAK